MRIWKKSFASRARFFKSALFAYLLAGLVIQSEAQVFNFSYGSYSLGFNTNTASLVNFTAGAVNQLNSQSLYYSVNGDALTSINSTTFGLPVIHKNSGGGQTSYTFTYSIAGTLSVADDITINGSGWGELIKFQNLSVNSATVSIFQYSDFVLGGASGSQTVNIDTTGEPTQAFTTQTGGGATLTWNGQLTSGTVEVQADPGGAPFGAFLGNASPTTLDNSTLTASGNAVFGYEFDGNLSANGSLTISDVASIAVPEPSSVAVISAGMLALALRRRRRGA